MLRSLMCAAALAVAPVAVHAQQTDTTKHDSAAVAKKTHSTVDNAGEGVKQAKNKVTTGAYKLAPTSRISSAGSRRRSRRSPTRPQFGIQCGATVSSEI